VLRLPILCHAVITIALLLPCTVLLAQQGAGKVYKSVDENGRVIFTDIQPSDKPAELIKVQPTNTTPKIADDAKSSSVDDEVVSTVGYTRFTITSPANNQTMEYDVSSVDVTLALEPALQEEHRVQFILDGKPYDEPGTTLSTRFGNLTRGSHSVQALVLNAKGKRIKSTRVVAFTIQLHTEQQTYNNGDDYYDYPYGVRPPRGAGSADGAGAPGSANTSFGAESIEGAQSPEYPVVTPRPRPRRH
jgi:hypothetical protein